MSRAVLSAGSNMGDTVAHLSAVVRAVGGELVAVSGVYATPPWGGVEQADFHNITLIADGPRDAPGWLELCRELERDADRVRDIRWGPRTLDVDVITVDDRGVVLSDDPELTLPHPRAAERAFVLVPWLEIEPGARLWTAGGPRPIAELIAALPREEVAAVTRILPGAAVPSLPDWVR
ncbi:2-amino-4-hydroxy-6-hydroxymethyldihydropteridine diphosphokinase [Gordonia amarae]|uniref:2-amino-4-hydroxy-6-hydroxymethyldihydropteridine diphosphokinase n=1 Tax=Gordonia amarae TaxID=36821 RepID=A0A857L363_9ACTN|nr:2-amino-4-hydroxy-6-hydroxymethyldihydropteridine diphosphokinase [Gordonia amarae]MCS3880561.1 2-amino-4-hydroxy-6-hydroxymethyldihydropteridine diphosphokinase [Gordonia amarae]QHN18885.1 2-amino-4-hydroxy-6-hydroxymethyldihydropteridine diphosphokinase [Gordonia amarae]QHN23360.1 2-amino-4-hydroxy-6-hydroxymethyldihydropteridine diphosphokinase [Gordonia amarae]QHN32260.1 2-amino-4-hydroxy-6-hydroxymethyldihydropteridine diphosphokinase [Gordonia amarae]QHN41008.1 2-amino-4-hydroxy-6-hyd